MEPWDKFAEKFPDAKWPAGFADAIVGHCVDGRLILNVEKILAIMVFFNGLSYEDAVEHFNRKIIGKHLGDETPIYLFPVKPPSDYQ